MIRADALKFLDNYVRRRDLRIRPFFCVNHGPTTSMYYRDPALTVTGWSCRSITSPRPRKVRTGCCRRPSTRIRSIGIEYDPDILVERFRSGVPVAELVVRD
jgi:hypothetical protein